MSKILDLTGQKFGKLTAIRIDNTHHKRPEKYWLCKCDCGKEIFSSSYNLTHNHIKSCGCLRNPDLTGKKLNKLTVINYTNKRDKRGNRIWLCKCDCGNIKEVNNNDFISNNVKSCGCLIKENAKLSQQRMANAKRYKDRTLPAFNTLYYHYNKNAKLRNLTFNLTKEEFKNFTYQNCYYCNKEPTQIIKHRTSSYKYNGIDRVNNFIGYNIDNCVTSCGNCNSMKMDTTQKEFLDQIIKIYDHLNLKGKIINE